MDKQKQRALLGYLRAVPEWQSALIYDQLATLNKAASELSQATGALERGFADGVLRPDRFYVTDPDIRKDYRTSVLEHPIFALGKALAALEVLGTLSDTRPVDFPGRLLFFHDQYYDNLAKLCKEHGYMEEIQ